jgi:hypothetical protein
LGAPEGIFFEATLEVNLIKRIIKKPVLPT